MNYSNELAKIKGLVSEDVWDLFVDYDVIIGGGAITHEPLDKIQLLGDVKVIAVYTKTEFISKFTNKS